MKIRSPNRVPFVGTMIMKRFFSYVMAAMCRPIPIALASMKCRQGTGTVTSVTLSVPLVLCHTLQRDNPIADQDAEPELSRGDSRTETRQTPSIGLKYGSQSGID